MTVTNFYLAIIIGTLISLLVDELFGIQCGGHLPEMLMKIKEALQPDGCIVFNSVSADSKKAFMEGAGAAGLILHPSVRIALNDYNPIEIMKATLS